MAIIGEGSWRYDFQRDWAKLPRWWNLGETGLAGPPKTSVQGAVAANGDVYVLCRAAHPVLVFDADGNFVSSWGEGEFSGFVHGLSIDRQGKIWIADSGLHTVTQHDPDGTLLRTLGTRNAAAPTYYGQPFNMPTGTAFTSDGDVFVSDGYGNRRVHRFAGDGTLKHSWGEHGTGPGQFVLVHFIAADRSDQLYVCDRDNHRIQIFSPEGETLAVWPEFKMPSDLAFGQDVIYVAGGDGLSIWTAERRLITRFGPDVAGEGSLNIHGIWIDAEENIYLAQFDRAVSKLTRRPGLTPLAWLLGLLLPACGAEGAAGLPVPTPMDMTRIERPATPNTFLAGPAGMSPPPDIVTEIKALPATTLYEKARVVFSGQPRTFVAAEFPDRLQIHYVVRSALLNFPDLVTVQANTAGADQSSLVIWSRSVYGRSDFGVNRDRTKAWLAALQQSKER